MKLGLSARKISAILLALSLCFVNLSSNQNKDSLKTSETLYVSLFIAYPYTTQTAYLVKNVVIDFNYTEGPPINTSLPAFGEHFHHAKYEVIPWGAQGDAVRVSAYFDLQISNDTADQYGNSVCEEFLKVFKQTDLREFDRAQTIDKATNTIKVRIDRGFFQVTATSIENIIKYKPTDGFGQLITKDLITLYTYKSHITFIYLEYTLTRVGQNAFSWRFTLGFCGDIPLSEYINLNLNEWLNHSGPIIPWTQGSSKIIIEIEKSRTTHAATYFLSLDSISPAYTSIQEDGSILVTYVLTGPIDNVIARIKISKEKQGFNLSTILATIVIIAVIATTISIIIILKKSKNRPKISRSYQLHMGMTVTGGEKAC